VLATVVGAGAVLWHTAACVESPMSFSPTGDLAFVVMDPYDLDHTGLVNHRIYRLMVLTKDRELREIEVTSSHLLSAPAYSPDGEQLAYLRMPLLTPEERTRIGDFIEEREKEYKQAIRGQVEAKWILVAPGGPIFGSPQGVMEDWKDVGLPPLKQLEMFVPGLQAGGGLIFAELVVRQASTGEPVKSLPVGIPIAGPLEDEYYSWPYILTRPQYSPDGRWVYFWMDFFAMAVSPDTGEKRLLAVQTTSALLSPDGKTVATVSGPETLGFVRTDGEKATQVRGRHEPSWSGLAWADKDTLVVLGEGGEKEGVPLDVYDADGDLLRSQTLPIPGQGRQEMTGELALSLDGEYMAISFGDYVHFLTADGQVLRSWQSPDENELLVQPTFSLDSRQVAFKLMEQQETEGATWMGTVAIVFFTPDGRELFRVPIPRLGVDEPPEPPAPMEPAPVEPAPAEPAPAEAAPVEQEPSR
jgi:hypothetical protein